MRYQQNIVWLFERHKPSPITNTSILIKVMTVTSGKHSGHDTEPACFVICTLLEPLRHHKLHCIACSTWTSSTDAMCVRFQLWVFSGGFPVNVVTKPLVCLGRMSATWSYRNSTVFDRTCGTEQLHCSNSGETFCAAIAVSRTDSIALTGTVLRSTLSHTNPVDLQLKSIR